MSLLAIKTYLQTHSPASLQEIVDALSLERDIARDMLTLWMEKGKVEQHTKHSACTAHCDMCPKALTEMYVWVGEDSGLNL